MLYKHFHKNKNAQIYEANKSQEQEDINIKQYLEDMNKTLELNLDIISKYCQKNKKIKEIINSINSKIKKKEEIQKKI